MFFFSDRSVEALLKGLKSCHLGKSQQAVQQLLRLTSEARLKQMNDLDSKDRLSTLLNTYPVLKKPEHVSKLVFKWHVLQ